MGCLHHKKAVGKYVPANAPLPPTDLRSLGVPLEMEDVTGVPQFSPNSGVCWFATVCWNTFLNKQVCKLVYERLPSTIHDNCKRCLRSMEAAKAVREFLWYTYRIGDDVTQDPSLDGRNGFREFMTLCARIKVPIILYSMSGSHMSRMKPFTTDRRGHTLRFSHVDTTALHLLALRYTDEYTPSTISRRLEVEGRRYRLVGMYMGSSACGHQIGACSMNGNWRQWAITDADLHKDGVGPIYVSFQGPQWVDGWKDAWKDLVHVTKYGHEKACSLSPRNVDNAKLKKFVSNTIPGKATAVDLLYVSAT